MDIASLVLPRRIFEVRRLLKIPEGGTCCLQSTEVLVGAL